jgi:hypothetical protein
MFESLGRLRWRLTLTYSAVTVGALLVVVAILGTLLFSRVLVPLEALQGALSPEAWIRIVSESAPPSWRYLLSQDPVDMELISTILEEGDLQVTHLDLFRVGDLQVRARTTGQGSVLIVDPKRVLLGTSNSNLVPPSAVGQPLDPGVLPGLGGVLTAALSGESDAEKLFVTLEPNERFYFALPYLDETQQQVLGVGIIYFENLPTEDDIAANTLALLGRSVLVLLFAAGLVGTVKGHVSNILSKLQLADRTQAAVYAWREGLMPRD